MATAVGLLRQFTLSLERETTYRSRDNILTVEKTNGHVNYFYLQVLIYTSRRFSISWCFDSSVSDPPNFRGIQVLPPHPGKTRTLFHFQKSLTESCDRIEILSGETKHT